MVKTKDYLQMDQMLSGHLMEKVAFTKDDDNEKSQLFIKFLISDSETKITNSDKQIEDFAWSKNGTFIAYSAFNEYEDDWVIEIPGEKEGESYNWTEDPTVVTTMHWRADGSW